MSALKPYDYLAVGLPIVTTDFPAVQEFRDVVNVADSKENFVAHIRNFLTEDTESLAGERRRKAAQNTWEHRVGQLSNIIQSCLREKSNR